MTDWITTTVIVGIVVVACIYSYSVLRLFHSIRKCPDCGRIMQKVRYEDPENLEQAAIYCECPFCQSTLFHPTHRGKKLTLHP
jgi:hypothetical protein